MQDRERFLALPQVPDTQHSITPKNPPNPPSGGASGTGGILTSSMTSGGGTLKVCYFCTQMYLKKRKALFNFITFHNNQKSISTSSRNQF